MESAVKTIPEMLIYEMVDGKPIYYKGYKYYLSGDKQFMDWGKDVEVMEDIQINVVRIIDES